MKGRILILLVMVASWAAMAVGQQLTSTPKSDAAAAKPVKTTAGKAPVYRPKVVKPVDGDQAYKANCGRCHLEPRKFSERKMATIMRHMQVRANMPAEEAQAILRYLTK